MRQADKKHKNDAPDDRAATSNPKPIRSEHKGKLAVIYVRQATPDHPTESTESQRALAKLPRRWGWPKSLITIIEDLGSSGFVYTQRPGFRRLVEMIDGGKVGIVLVRDFSRLSRNPLDLKRFFIKAMRHGVLMQVHGHVFDPARSAFRELRALWPQLLARWENKQRMAMLQGTRKSGRGDKRVRKGDKR